MIPGKLTLPKRRLPTSVIFAAKTNTAFKPESIIRPRKHWSTRLNFHSNKYSPMQCCHIIFIRAGPGLTLGYALICARFFFLNASKGKENIHSTLAQQLNIVSKVPLAVEDRNVSGDNTEHVSTEPLSTGAEGGWPLYTPPSSKAPYHSIICT